jgi:hypothetical protein
MLQAGFGYSPLASGMTTLATALGAMTMKFGAETLLKRYGFRRTLVTNTLLSAASLAVLVLFTPATPAIVIFLVLLIGGFFRSLTFTALNSLAFADLDGPRMSQATGFWAVAQQLSLSIGVGLAAMVLNLVRPERAPPSAEDFVIPFAVIGLVVALSAIQFATLSPNAGSAVTARGPAVARPARNAPEGGG